MNAGSLDFWARSAGSGPRIVGHRGSKGGPPENTIGAFERGVSLGATAVELDVRVCASGELVVFHDPTLGRLTNGRDDRRVADLSRVELAAVRLSGGGHVPMLADVFEALPKAVGVNVEMKHDVPNKGDVVRATVAEVRNEGSGRAVIVSSFDPRMVLALQKQAPDIARALLVHRSNYHPLMLAAASGTKGPQRPMKVHAVHLERNIATARRVDALKARGLIVSVWTVNDIAEAKRLSLSGVDSLITDVPEQLV